ncbi:hypothetical protein ERO13_A10G175400v2 [Gossypium hirsutum]|nr:hypothetical protein ERO13_A10G175400v2 [Gossypium hirsutum]
MSQIEEFASCLWCLYMALFSQIVSHLIISLANITSVVFSCQQSHRFQDSFSKIFQISTIMTSHFPISKQISPVLFPFSFRICCAVAPPFPHQEEIFSWRVMFEALNTPIWSRTTTPEANRKFSHRRLHQTVPLISMSPLLGYGYFR